MLGMIDDRFTHQLLGQVCQGQGAEALETVADMALRSVDFNAALDEILTTLHNISLHQINPQAVEWKGIDSSTLAPLAQQVDAELLQLIYQIALIGKRDLALAPDPRSGFEMILLRMISFRPESSAARPATGGKPQSVTASAPPRTSAAPKVAKQNSPPAAQSAPSSAKNNPVAAAASGTKVATKPATEPTTKPAPEPATKPTTKPEPKPATANLTLEQLDQGESWTTCIEQSGLRGMARELMMNMVPVSVSEHTLHLTLDADHATLSTPERVQKIETRLAKQFSLPLKLEVSVQAAGADNGDTPSRQRERTQQKTQQAADQAFRHDPNVQELVDLFDGEIVNDSISPPAN